jgi:predicted nucleic acid-binding protein
MDRPRVYIETTIPSAYFDERRAPRMVARREATRRWWAGAADKYEMVTSLAVREELAAGPSLRRSSWLSLIERVPSLEVTSEVIETAAVYRSHKLMPAGDAIHLALSSCHHCEVLLTWNFKHLANANKFGHIESVNRRRGLHVPRIVAPSVLLGEEDEQA